MCVAECVWCVSRLLRLSVIDILRIALILHYALYSSLRARMPMGLHGVWCVVVGAARIRPGFAFRT